MHRILLELVYTATYGFQPKVSKHIRVFLKETVMDFIVQITLSSLVCV